MNSSEFINVGKNHEKKGPEVLESYNDYLDWLKTSFFTQVRNLAAAKFPVLITGFIMDQNGAIAKDGKVPLEIANQLDWQAFMWFLASADVFITGMRYLLRVIEAIKKGQHFQNILFPYENHKGNAFLESLQAKADFFPEIGEFRKKMGLPRSPDIYIATTDLEKYRGVLESAEFKEIVEAVKKLGRNIVIIKKGPFTEEEIKLMQEAGVFWKSYTKGISEQPGKHFIESIAEDYNERRGKRPSVIANTTGPSVKRLLFEASETGGYPLFLEAVVAQEEIKGDNLTYFEGDRPIPDPIKYLEENQGFSIFARTSSLPATAVSGNPITQTFNVLAQNI